MKLRREGVYYLEGAVGTEILRRGFPTKLPLWSAKVLFEKPELLKGIYLDYIRAGADIITTNTFRTQRRTLARAGLANETERINRLAVEIALQAREEAKAERPVYVAGCITTLEDCYRPDLVPSQRELEREHGEQVELLASTPVDFLLLETFNSIGEALVAVRAAGESGKDFAISFTANADGDILSGGSWREAVGKVEQHEPIFIGVNCVPPSVASKALMKMREATSLPLAAYGNGAGEPGGEDGWKFTNADHVNEFAAHCRDWVELGATVIGGCCGTNQMYTEVCSKLKRL
jgi:S-methylmethionine-dependent homocysteine/selenocysteine methylase